MALMTSPDGTETVDVPDSLVAHYQSLGAKVAAAPQQPAVAPGPAQSRIQYTGTPDMPLNYGNNMIDSAIANPVETAQLLAGLPGLVRSIPAIGSAVGRAGIETAGEIASLSKPFLRRIPILGGALKEVAKPAAAGLENELGNAASLGVRSIHPSDAGRALRAARDAKAAASIAQKEAAPAAEQTIARSLGDQGSSVEKFTAEVTPEAEKTAAGQAAKRTVKPGAKGAKGKPLPGSAESRIKIVPRNAGQAGKSTPKLVRQGAANADDLAGQLQKSIEFESEMAHRGLTPEERAIARKLMARGVNPFAQEAAQ